MSDGIQDLVASTDATTTLASTVIERTGLLSLHNEATEHESLGEWIAATAVAGTAGQLGGPGLDSALTRRSLMARLLADAGKDASQYVYHYNVGRGAE